MKVQVRSEGAGGESAPSVERARRTPDRAGVIGTAAVLAVIALQVAIPSVALLQPPPQKLGFQMYSGAERAITATIIEADGSERPFSAFDEILAKYRPDTNWLPLLPEGLCTYDPEATSVRVEQSGKVRSIECD